MSRRVIVLNQALVLYGTSCGQTAKIARFIADYLTSHGVEVQLVDGESTPPGLSLRDFDGVVIGASVIRGRFQRSVRRFVGAHREALNAMPSAFFSVSASAASRDLRGRMDAGRRCIEDFLRETGWRPALIESVGGAMAFTKYSPLRRWVLKQISKRNGGPTDTSRDHELTDWAQVARFADSFIEMLPDGDCAQIDSAAGAQR